METISPGIGERMGSAVQSRMSGKGGVDLFTEGFEIRLFLQDGKGIGKQLLGLFFTGWLAKDGFSSLDSFPIPLAA